MSDLADRSCKPLPAGTPALTAEQCRELLHGLDGWNVDHDVPLLVKKFDFGNYYETMAFVNAVAWIAHREDHHPEMEVSYNTCTVRYNTHSIGGLSDNDFICAAKIEALSK